MATYTIKSRLGTNLYLNVYGTGTITGRRNVCLWTKTDSNDQKWSISSLGKNVKVYSMNNTKYALNARTDTWNCDVIIPTTDSDVNFLPSGIYFRIQLVSHPERFLTADGSSSSANVSWALESGGNNQLWDVQKVSTPVTPPSGGSHVIQMPNRPCNWNQYYTEIANATGNGGKYACTITTALDLMNFYGPNSYTISDAIVGWGAQGITWGTSWPGNFRAGTGYSNQPQATMLALIRSEIDQNRPVIVNVGTGNSHSHTVMCYGYQNGGTDYKDFLVMDPAGLGASGASNPNGEKRTLWEAMVYSSKTEGVWNIRFTYSKN